MAVQGAILTESYGNFGLESFFPNEPWFHVPLFNSPTWPT